MVLTSSPFMPEVGRKTTPVHPFGAPATLVRLGPDRDLRVPPWRGEEERDTRSRFECGEGWSGSSFVTGKGGCVRFFRHRFPAAPVGVAKRRVFELNHQPSEKRIYSRRSLR